MREKRVVWERPVTPLPGESVPIKGGIGACREMIRTMPRDGEWYRSKWPFSPKSNNANQAKLQLGLEYPSFEFRVQTMRVGGDKFKFVWIRFRADEVQQ